MRCLISLALLTAGCTPVSARVSPGARLARTVQETGPVVGPCDADLATIRDATYSDAAMKSVRGYLQCVRRQEAASPDLMARVEEQLRRNPYPAATARLNLLDYFFDTDQIKKLPESTGELAFIIQQLQDQSLARAAMGDMDLADAAMSRSIRLEQLLDVVSDLEE